MNFRTIIHYGRQWIDEADIEAVSSVMSNDLLTLGPAVELFEKEFAAKVGSNYAIAVSSGTAALHLSCLALGLQSGDEVITSPMTFAASANCALYCNAKPVFVDIKENGLIDEELIEAKITNKTKIIIPVHYSGLACNLQRIHQIAKKYDIRIIEDACHALGSKYKNRTIGDCCFSDIAVFSLHPVKHITTGEGGMITTNNKNLYEQLKCLRNHGIERKSDPPWYYEINNLGYNYRITDFQGALGLSQLRKLDFFVNRRRELAERYNNHLKGDSAIGSLEENVDQFNSYHLYIIKSKKRNQLYLELKEKNIYTQVHYVPVYYHPLYKKLGYVRGLCQKAERFYEEILSIPLYPKLTIEEQDFVISNLK